MPMLRAARLGDLINDGMKDSAFSKRKFLPQDAFEEVMVKENVKRELMRSKIYREDLLDFIMENARRVFATLVRSRLVHRASKLDIYKFTDKYLPVELEDGQIKSLKGAPADDPALSWFQIWSDADDEEERVDGEGTIGEEKTINTDEIRSFCNDQWLFLAPVFTRESIMDELHEDCLLPFIKYERKTGGGYSFLHQGVVHKAHEKVLDGVSCKLHLL
jgi:hypothetical protein